MKRVSLAAASLACACVLEAGERCGPHEVLWSDEERCVCAEGTAYSPEGCVPCAENEVASAQGCVCRDGYARSAPGAACQESSIGQSCTDDSQCSDPRYPHCQLTPLDGYCTSTGCGSSAVCTEGYACDTSAAPPYCKRPPLGAGKPCDEQADCADTEATFCELSVSSVCMVRDCDDVSNPCFQGWECCPIGGLPNLCIPLGQCFR